MKVIGVIVVIILAILLYIGICKIVRWMYDFDKRTDRKMFKIELEDYDNDKKCALASITVAFVIITAILVFLVITHW